MTIERARRILGLEPGDDPAKFLEEFDSARERIAVMVRSAPNSTLALRYQEGLDEFDEALGVVAEEMKRAEDRVRSGEDPGAEPRRRGKSARWTAVVLSLVILGCGGLWLHLRIREDMKLQRQARMVFLERQGAVLVENRRWGEAAVAYKEIEELESGSVIAAHGRRNIAAGIEEEQRQFLAYWTGEGNAAVETARWQDAETALAKLEERLPGSEEVTALRQQIAEGKRLEARRNALNAARMAFAEGKWEEVRKNLAKVLSESPGDAEAVALREETVAAVEREAANLMRARKLFEKARPRDRGVFDEEALEWMREATQLAPDDDEIAELYRKMSSYTRTLEVPGDYATIAGAIAAARPRDRIRIGEGTFTESLRIDKVLELEGAGRDKTLIECRAEDGPVVTWDAGAESARVTGLKLGHSTMAPESERFSVGLVRGGQVLLSDCELSEGSGHGLAVIEGGVASLTRCKFENNGWDGVAVYGEGSRIEVRECESLGNYEHGFDIWKGATAVIRGSTASGNGRNGIFIATAGLLTIESTQLAKNREFGLVVARAEGGSLRGNRIERNGMGGIALHREARAVEIRDNQSQRNSGPGLVLDKGFTAAAYEGNEISSNRSTRQIAKDVTLDAGQGGEDAAEE